MVFTKALLSPPVWKKQPQAMKPAHTSTKPARGPSARNAQMAPRTAILKERPTTCDMAYPLLDIGYGCMLLNLRRRRHCRGSRADSQELRSISHRAAVIQGNLRKSPDRTPAWMG